MFSTLPKKFFTPAEQSGLPKDSPILLGFSGGPDSMALLHMLHDYAKEAGAVLYAAHVHHGIRGKEADRDEAFCREVAESLGIELFVLHADVPALSKESGESIETTARRVRYDFFDRLMLEKNIPLLATAHNANDNLETMLFHMVRGSGLTGLCGIPVTRPCAGGLLIRPILSMTRGEILDYCKERGLSYVCDSTNVDTDYTRNKIRQTVIPALTDLHPNAVENAARLAETLREDDDCLEGMTTLFLAQARQGNGLLLDKIADASPSLVCRGMMRLYAELSQGISLEYTHLKALRALASKRAPHAKIALPCGIEAVIEHGTLLFRPTRTWEAPLPYDIVLSSQNTPISQINGEIFISPSQSEKNVYKNSIQISLDSATIKGQLRARSRQVGDRILQGGMHKSLKKLFCEKKTPLELRSKLPVLCDDDGIVAVPTVALRDGARPKKDSIVLTLELHFLNDATKNRKG